MTAPSLTGNFSKFGTYYLYKLRTLRSMIILNSIFALLSYPLAFGIAIPTLKIWEDIALYQIQTEYRDTPRLQELLAQSSSLESLFIASIVIGCIMLGAIFIMNFVVTNKSFRWLYKKSIVDMDYSLPVSGDTRFCGDLLATLTTCLVPHLLAICAGLVLWQFVPKGERVESASGAMNEAMVLLGNMIPQLMFTGFIASIMLIALTLFIMSLCGRDAESRLYPAVFNVVIPVVLSVCIGIVISNTYGAYDSVYGFTGESLNSYTAVASTSPLGLLFYTFVYTFDTSSWGYADVVYTAPILRPEIIIPLIIITLALLVGAYFLVRNRRAERVGSAFVYNVIKFVIPALVIFSIVASFSTYILGGLFPNRTIDAYMSSYYGYSSEQDVSGYIIAMLIITFVLYVIMELISGKGFKKFHITLLKYVITVGGSFLICMGLFFSNGMGAGYYVPNSSDVVSAYVGLHDNSDTYGYSVYGEVKLPENVQAVVDVHNDIPKNGLETNAQGYSFMVNYHLKDGTTLGRYYFISEERYNEACEKLFSAELYASSELTSTITDIPTEGISEFTQIVTDTGISYDCHIPAAELRDALLKDSEKASPELMYDPTKRGASVYLKIQRTDTVGDSASVYTTGLDLYAWYDNTIALFERYGVTGLFDVDTSQFEIAYFLKIDKTAYIDPSSHEDEMNIEAWYIATREAPTENDYLIAGFEEEYMKYGDEAKEAVLNGYLSDAIDVVAVPIDSDVIDELYMHSFSDYYGGYDEDVVYELVLSMYPHKTYGVKRFFISEDYIDRAEEIFAAHK